MDFRESETVALKSVVAENVRKEILAFANTNGGTLYIGVSDNGDVIGVSNTEKTIQQIANIVRDSVNRISPCSCTTKQLRSMKNRLFPSRSNRAPASLIIWQRKACARRVFMSDRVLLPFRPVMPQSAE